MTSSTWEGHPSIGFSTVESLLEEVSKNMAASNLSRYSRGFSGQSGQRTSGSRVVKSGSTSNSPRNSTGLGRRMTDGAYRRRLALMDQNTLGAGAFVSNDNLQPSSSSQRPVSWHPASHIQHEPSYQSIYPSTSSQSNNAFPAFDLPPTPVAYSGYTSPASNFSPVSAPYNGYEQQQYNFQNRPHSYHPINYDVISDPFTQPINPVDTSMAPHVDPTMYSHFDFSNFTSNDFENSTAPPTPDNFLPIQHPEPTFPAEETIPYHPLDDSEDTGEELIGMGLYDNPEAAKSPQSDPHLDNYRSLMMSQLLGTAYRRPEPSGKGLKLEETWNPPASEDEEDEENSEEDGEAEDDDNEPVQEIAVDAPRQHNTSVGPEHHSVVGGLPTHHSQSNVTMQNRDGWL